MIIKARELASMLGGKLEGDPEVEVSDVAKIEEAKPGDVSFLANPKYEHYLSSTGASIVLVSESQETPTGNYIRIADPYMAFAKLLIFFHPPEEPPEVGVHTTAFIDQDVQMGDKIRIAPNVVVGKSCIIGDNVTLYPGVVIGDRVTIGKDTTIRAGVSIRIDVRVGQRVVIQDNAVIGSDGFGFAPKQEGDYAKIPQVGTVIIEDDVEIGAGCTIDRATLGSTVIQRGTKLDNLIQVAHNVVIGENTVIAAQTGISGSVKIGRGCMIGGQVGFAGHIDIGDDSKIGAQSGLSKSFPDGSVLFGTPAQDLKREFRTKAALNKLPELTRTVHRLEKEIEELRRKSEDK